MVKRLFSVLLLFVVLAACVLPVFCAAEAASLIIGSASVAGMTSASAAAVSVPIIGAVVLAACAATGAYLYIGNQAQAEGLTRTEWLQEHYPGLFTGAFLAGLSVTAAGQWYIDETAAGILDAVMTDINGNIVSADGKYCVVTNNSGVEVEGILVPASGSTIISLDSATIEITNGSDYDVYFFPTASNYAICVSEYNVGTVITYKWWNNSTPSNIYTGSLNCSHSSSIGYYYSNVRAYFSRIASYFPSPYITWGENSACDFGTGVDDDYTGFAGSVADYFDTSIIDNRNGLMINPDIIDFDNSTFSGTLDAERYAQLYLDWLDGKTAEEAGYPDIVLNPTDVIDPTITTYLDPDIVTDADPVPEAAEAVEGETVEDTTDDYTLDLKDLFPFCIPFDLYDIFVAFNGSAVAPSWSWSFTVYDQQYTISGDLSSFDSVAAVCRTLELIAFCVCLAIGTKNLIQGS